MDYRLSRCQISFLLIYILYVAAGVFAGDVMIQPVDVETGEIQITYVIEAKVTDELFVFPPPGFGGITSSDGPMRVYSVYDRTSDRKIPAKARPYEENGHVIPNKYDVVARFDRFDPTRTIELEIRLVIFRKEYLYVDEPTGCWMCHYSTRHSATFAVGPQFRLRTINYPALISEFREYTLAQQRLEYIPANQRPKGERMIVVKLEPRKREEEQ